MMRFTTFITIVCLCCAVTSAATDMKAGDNNKKNGWFDSDSSNTITSSELEERLKLILEIVFGVIGAILAAVAIATIVACSCCTACCCVAVGAASKPSKGEQGYVIIQESKPLIA